MAPGAIKFTPPRLSVPSASTIKSRLTSIKAWEVEKTDSAFTPDGHWSNEDMEPVPRELWSWTTSTFAAYWCSDLINAQTWSSVSSLMSLGLTWWEGILAIFFGGFFLSTVIALNGIIGARLHTPFAVTARAAFGYHLAKFCVISRMVIGFWFSVQTYNAGTGVTQMIIALAPSYRNFPNHLPASAGVTSQDFLSFFIFWLIQFPFCLVHPSRLRPIFIIKAVLLPIVALGTMAWAIHLAGDKAGPALVAKSTLSGSTGFLSFMTAVTSSMGTWVTLACNIGDFSRYSKKPTSAALQITFVPGLWALTSLFGAISANCTSAVYGTLLFTPFQVIAKWQENNSSVGRFFAFVCSLIWCLGTVGTNITANSISAANDSCTLLPRYITIFRGQIIAIVVGTFGFAPWKVLASASAVVNFAGSYSVVLAPIASILCADYYLVKRSRYDVPALYDQKSIYYYTFGINWRALVALIIGIAPNLPGMANALNSSVNIGGAKYIYAIGDIYGLIVGAIVHTFLSRMFPDRVSLVNDAIYAQDIWDAQANGSSGHSSAVSESDEKESKDETLSTSVAQVV